MDQLFPVEKALRAEITGHFSVVNVSGGQTILALSGKHAVDVLKKSTVLDLQLHHADRGNVTASQSQQAGVELRELALRGHLVLRGSQNSASFMQGCLTVLGLPLPTAPLTSAEDGDIVWAKPCFIRWQMAAWWKRKSAARSLSIRKENVNMSETLLPETKPAEAVRQVAVMNQSAPQVRAESPACASSVNSWSA
ncbi:hypothetical protein CRX72_21220 [Pantoea sp. BRM17]|nr:hypothetical protein CRX72_21220 [Pantoea sp. BRM17]